MLKFHKILSVNVIAAFVLTTLSPNSRVFAAENVLLNLPAPGAMVAVSKPMVPVMLKGLHINPKDPLVFDFLVSKGEGAVNKEQYAQEVERLARYFLASMTIPESDLWVNLSPFEKEKIIADSLSKTEMGQNMLAQDYLLKQLTASMLYPEKDLGKEFWSRVYEQTKKQFGSSNIPVNTFNKVWILADTATAVEKQNSVFITGANLKVMLEEDFLALKRNQGKVALTPATGEERVVASNVIRQIILPEIEKEVNTGANFAPLRQIFNAFVLSSWYKKALKQAILNQVYTDKSKTGGIEADDPAAKQKIYDQYIQAYKKGVFNYIKEEEDGMQRRIPRKYFSGGAVVSSANIDISNDPAMFTKAATESPIDTARVKFDAAMNAPVVEKSHANVPSVLDLTNARKFSGDELKALEAAAMNEENNITARVVTEDVKRDVHDYLGSATDIDTIQVVRVTGANQNVLKYGYATDYTGGRLYIGDDFLSKITAENGLFFFFQRKIIKMKGQSSDEGRDNEIEFLRKKLAVSEKDAPAAKRLKEATTKKIRDLFPGTAQPEIILQRIKDALLIDPTIEKGVRKAADYQETVDQILGPNNGYQVVEPKVGPIDANVAAFRQAKRALDIIYINALDGIANYKTTMPSTLERMKQMQEPLSYVQLSSKFNPITIAHIIVTMLSVFAISGANDYIINPSEFDPRKREIEKTIEARMKLAEADSRSVLDAFVTLLDIKDKKGALADGDHLRYWNGEEVLYLMAEAFAQNAKLLGSKIFYTAGADHFYVWAPIGGKKDSKAITFFKMDEQIRKYYAFYVERIPGAWKFYQSLVRQQMGAIAKDRLTVLASIKGSKFDPEYQGADGVWESVTPTDVRLKPGITVTDREIWQKAKEADVDALNEIFAEARKYANKEMRIFYDPKSTSAEELGKKASIEAILAARSQEQISKVFAEAKVLPGLDTAGKVYIFQQVFKGKLNILFSHTVRANEVGEDPVRDDLIGAKALEVLEILGIREDIAATYTRKGLVKTLFKIFDFNFLFGSSIPSMKQIFDAKSGILNLLLRQGDGVLLPRALAFMLPGDHAKAEADKQVALDKLKGKLPKGWEVSEEIKPYALNEKQEIDNPGSTVVTVSVPVKENKVVKVSYEYQVLNSFDAAGNNRNTLYRLSTIAAGDKDSQAALRDLEDYIKESNNVPLTDKAMSAEDAKAIVKADAEDLGGIEFNQDDLKLNVQKDGQGVEFAIDPKLLEQLRRDDFGGFKPVVLDITPMTVSSPLLN